MNEVAKSVYSAISLIKMLHLFMHIACSFPGYHSFQIADAVVVARQLRATLVIPDIRGSEPGDKR